MLGVGVHVELRRARHARLADLPRDDGRVRGRPAFRGQDALGDGHAGEVVGRGLLSDEDDLLAALGPGHGVAIREDGLADGGAGRGVEPSRQERGGLQAGLVELVAEELVDVRRLDPPDRLFLRDDPLLDHLEGRS